jgi:hypothetical protein
MLELAKISLQALVVTFSESWHTSGETKPLFPIKSRQFIVE